MKFLLFKIPSIRLLVALLLSAVACGPQDDTFPADQTLSIINGYPDTAPSHDAIVAVHSRTSQGQELCTGSLVGRRVVLTAAHCVDESEADDITIGFGRNSTSPTSGRQVEAVSIHPLYDWPSYDFALLRFTDEPPSGIEPIPALPAGLGITQGDEGRPLELVGYGKTETGGFGERRTITLAIDTVCTGPSGCHVIRGSYRFDVPPHVVCYDQSTGGVCFGDSGGPALFDRGGQEYVAGVHAMILENNDGHCDLFGCSIKADALWNFIDGFAHPVGEACNNDNDCISGYCTDGRCCTSRCAGICERCDAPGSLGTCTPLPNGSSCDDFNACNGRETCQDGWCETGTDINCDDGVDCTVDTCDPGTGCKHQPKWALCDDRNECTTKHCDATLGCVFDPLPDGHGCGADECKMCRAGECIRIPDCGEGGGCATAPLEDAAHPADWLLLLTLLPLLCRYGGSQRKTDGVYHKKDLSTRSGCKTYQDRSQPPH